MRFASDGHAIFLPFWARAGVDCWGTFFSPTFCEFCFSMLLILPFRFRGGAALGKRRALRFTSRNAIPLASGFRGLGESRATSPPAQPPFSG